MRLTRTGQMKLASDPESRSTGTWTWVPSQETRAVIAGWEAEGGELVVTPVRIPSLTDGRCLLIGQVDSRCPSPPQYRQRWFSRHCCRSESEILVCPTCIGSTSGASAARVDELWVRGVSRGLSGSRRRREARRYAKRALMRIVRSTRLSNEAGNSQVLSSSSRRSDSPL